jgi:type VI secretion system Hcp family effector
MLTKLFAATLLLVISQGTSSLRAQNKVGTMTITGPRTKVTGSLKDATSVMDVTLKNVASKQHEAITITREKDGSSPVLYSALSAKEVLTQVSFKVFKPGDASKYKTITLTNAIITSIKPSKPNPQNSESQAHSTDELEEVKFTFQKIEVENIGGSTSATDDWTANNQK